MRFRSFAPLALAAVALTGCLDSSISGPECQTIAAPSGTMVGDTLVTSAGLKVLETRVGTGTAVNSCQFVRVHFTGYLADGTQFDSSRGGNPIEFVPGFGQLIRGFEQGIVGMQVGGTRRVIMPPSLGYGNRDVTDQLGNVVIPANSTLIFDIEAMAVDTTRTF